MNIYTRNFKEICEINARYLAKGSVTTEELINLFPHADTKEITLEELDVTGKIAIVLLGLSGCGKTTLAKSLVRNNEALQLCSMDECTAQALLDSQFFDPKTSKNICIYNEKANDDVAMELFGKKLRTFAKKNNPLVIDGLWINAFTRAALFKTLKQLGYQICVIDFVTNYNKDDHLTKLMYRAAELVAFNFLSKDMVDSTMSDVIEKTRNAIPLLAKQRGVSEETILIDMTKEADFITRCHYLQENTHQEIITENVLFQKTIDLFKEGADIWISA